MNTFSPPGQSAALEATAAELVVEAAELEAADAAVDVESVADVDADDDADWEACVHTVAALCMFAVALRHPSAVVGDLGGGGGCVGAAVGDDAEDGALWLTRLSAD